MKVAIATRNVEVNAMTLLMNSGFIKLYTGSQPATPETSASGTLLCTLTCSSTAAPAASGGVGTFNAITSDTNAAATGTAGYARLFKSDATTVVADMSVGIAASGADVILDSLSIVAATTVACSSLTYTIPT